MTDSRFSRLESQLQTKVPVLSTANHVAVFFKQKILKMCLTPRQ